MKRLYIVHPPLRNHQETRLSADIDSGVTAIPVRNSTGLVADKFVLFGNYGIDQSEIVGIDSITDNENIVLATATKFPHHSDTKLTLMDYDQIRLYRATGGISGSYDLVNTFNIQPDNDTTPYVDPSGEDSYYYKVAYYNSITATEGTLSDPFAGSGFVFYSLNTMIDRVLSLKGDPNAEGVNRDEVKDAINEFLEEAGRSLAVSTKRHQISTYVIDLVRDTASYPLPADFLIEKAVKVSTNNGSSYDYPVYMKQLDSVGVTVSNRGRHTYTIVNGNIEFDDPVPNRTGDKAKIWYMPSSTTLSLPTDVLPAPFTTASAMFVKYGLAATYLKDKKMEEYTQLHGEARAKLEDFISYIRKLNSMHPQMQEMTSGY